MTDAQIFHGSEGAYTVTGRLGIGATAAVYRVDDEAGRSLALKVALASGAGRAVDLMGEAARLDRYAATEEARFGASEPRFPRVRDRDPGGRWFVMDLARGETLEAVLSAGKALRPLQCVGIARRLSQALAVVEQHAETATDLKPDAIFWVMGTERLTIVDWNVVGGDGGSPGAVSHVRLVCGLLDALLARKRISAWDGKVEEPLRWAAEPRKYPRAIVHLLTRCATASGFGIEDLVAETSALEEVMGLPHEEQLENARNALAESRQTDGLDGEQLAERAEALAELATRSRQLEIRFRAEELRDRACGYRGADRDRLIRLWRHLSPSGATATSDPGDALELIRLRALVGVARRAPGYADEVRAVAAHFANQAWRRAADAADALAHTIGDADIERLLSQVALEARLFADMAQALRRLDRADHRAAANAMARVRTSLGLLQHADRLLERFDAFQRAYEAIDTPSLDTDQKPAARPTEPDPVERARVRFATHGDTRLDGLGHQRDAEHAKALGRLIDTWQAVYDAATRDARTSSQAMLHAMKTSAEQGGCLPLPDLERHAQAVLRRFDDAFASASKLDEATSLPALARAMRPVTGEVRRALGGSSFEVSLKDEIRHALDEFEERFGAWADDREQTLQAFSDCRQELRALDLHGQLVRARRLVDETVDFGLARQLHSDVVALVHRESLDLSGLYVLADVNAARTELGLNPLKGGGSSVASMLVVLLLLGLGVAAIWFVLDHLDHTAAPVDAEVTTVTDAEAPPPLDRAVARIRDAGVSLDARPRRDTALTIDAGRRPPPSRRVRRHAPSRRRPSRSAATERPDARLAIPSVEIKVRDGDRKPDATAGKPEHELRIPKGLTVDPAL